MTESFQDLQLLLWALAWLFIFALCAAPGFRWRFFGAFCLPFLLSAEYLYLSRLMFFGSELCDWLVGAMSILVGLVCIWRLPTTNWVRISLSVIYVPAMGFALVIFSLYFVGFAFGHWL